MADNDYDVLVIGAGPGGYVAAIRAAQLGLKTACAESRETLGGTCLNVGCIPSKALLHGSELFEEAHTARWPSSGVKAGKVELDLAGDAGREGDAVKELTGGIEFLFKKNKVDLAQGPRQVHGRAHGRRGRQAASRRRTWSSPPAPRSRRCPGVEVDNAKGMIVDSTGALALDRVPEHMVVIGGGVIGLELGSVWRRLGAKVTVVEFLDQLLPGMDGEVRKEAAKLFAKQGMELRSSRPRSPARRVKGKKAHADARAGRRAALPKRSKPTACWSRSAAARTPRASASTRSGSRSTSAARSRPTTISAPRSTASGRSAT